MQLHFICCFLNEGAELEYHTAAGWRCFTGYSRVFFTNYTESPVNCVSVCLSV